VPTIFTIGPLLLTHNNKLEESKVDGIDNDCLQFLNQQPRSSVLYICFGTVFVLPTQQLNELAMGLETSGVRFLWVIRIPKGEDGNLAPEIATFIPKGFMERTKDKGLVYTSWAPQAQILAHPATGGFLTHCGWNSIMESISMGVPMITWPLYADQMLNGRFCVDVLNIAIAVDKKFKEIVGRKEVERVVQLLMEDATSNIARKNARELKKVVRNANEPGGSSRKSLDLFVDDLNAMTLLKKLNCL
jgi:hydroquinone glucosyltransferase